MEKAFSKPKCYDPSVQNYVNNIQKINSIKENIRKELNNIKARYCGENVKMNIEVFLNDVKHLEEIQTSLSEYM